MATKFKCRRRSTLVERSVESPDTLSSDRNLTKQSSSVFNQLPRSRLERVLAGEVHYCLVWKETSGDVMAVRYITVPMKLPPTGGGESGYTSSGTLPQRGIDHRRDMAAIVIPSENMMLPIVILGGGFAGV